MENKPLLVLGTRNRKKAEELIRLLAPVGLELKTLVDYPDALDVKETGDTFAANAALKAVQQAKHLGRWVLGEDSGLVVDALDGAPGIYSARYAGPGATDEDNIRKLLEELAHVPVDRRTARYVCHVCLADPSGRLRAEAEGACRGRIVHQPQGRSGFGYDPVFEVVEYHRTFGTLGPVVKGCISHRARAVGRLRHQLIELVDSGQWR
ncbi:MAG TPA: RdgB/HAM1 family non-canonical purine NTP pyrophosphatase [Planctomycetaceae bacterium]|nr:RdgB/HAM1 family non-canonical purine NTP pyrophosphatase [Planctomycetaceae bacterium]HIQ20329.1 RdgB/HAM1 family non-canonical purine NTP pyrophosphatase [Planctomycetota bacterium]